VLTQSQGGNVRMTVTPRGQWEHNAYQSDNQFVLEVKPVKEDPNKLTQGVGKAASAARSCRSTSRTSMSVRCCR
jgi:type IV pilus assembly protein PilQ